MSKVALLDPATRREELHREAVAMGSVGLGLGTVSGLLLAGSTVFSDHTVNTLFETAAQAEARRATQAGFVTASVAVGTAAVSSLVVALVLEILSER